MYKKNFEVRWNDVDANKHVGNSAYIEYMSHTRMSFFIERDLSIDTLNDLGLGPIVFYEHIYYFREILLGETITVSLEVSGYSEDGRFIKFEHNFYNKEGKNLAYSEMLFSWIDMSTRKLGQVPEALLKKIALFPRAKNFKFLTKEDTRKYGKVPVDQSF